MKLIGLGLSIGALLLLAACSGGSEGTRSSPPTSEAIGDTATTTVASPSTPAPTDTLEPSQVGLSREAPAPLGQAIVATEGWEVAILDVNGDAWPLIQAENSLNEPPEAGFRMVLIRVRAKNISAEEPATLFSGDIKLVGSADVGYSTFERSCGVTPDDLSVVTDIFRGGIVEGNLCFQVEVSETDLILFTNFSFSDSDRRWLSTE